jgi:hypothetical protein
MNTTEYRTLTRKTQELGDKFYECLSAWISDRSAKAKRSCIEHGRDYEEALVHQAEYLRRLSGSPSRDHALADIETFHLALESQLALLAPNRKNGN